jgi:putative addiction module component (TIGR02574 family)
MNLQIKDLTIAQKLNLLEELWDSLKQEDANTFLPSWHIEELKKREDNIKNNKAYFITLEEMEKNIERYFNEN